MIDEMGAEEPEQKEGESDCHDGTDKGIGDEVTHHHQNVPLRPLRHVRPVLTLLRLWPLTRSWGSGPVCFATGLPWALGTG